MTELFTLSFVNIRLSGKLEEIAFGNQRNSSYENERRGNAANTPPIKRIRNTNAVLTQ